MDFSGIFKQLGDMKGRMEEIRARASGMRISGEAGAGMVRVTADGEGKIISIAIDPALLGSSSTEPAKHAESDKAMLEELIISATNDALERAREALAHEMKGLTGGLNIPGLDKILGGMGGL